MTKACEGRGPEFLRLRSLSLMLFGGKGGVGKTTCAAATAIALARSRPDERFLLVSTDPAHSTSDSLGGEALPGNLTLVEVDAGAAHREFMGAHGGQLREIASRGTFLDEGDIDEFLSLSLPGIDELMAFLKIAEWVESRAYSCIVVDTAPTGHTLRLLGMPEFFGRWIGAMEALLAKHQYMSDLFSGGRRREPDESEAFLAGLEESFGLVGELLTDAARCRFVPVMVAEKLSVEETTDLVVRLDELGLSAPEVIVNRLIPDGEGSLLSAVRGQQLKVLSELPTAFKERRAWGLELQECETRGVDVLGSLLERLIEPAELETHVFRREMEFVLPEPERVCDGRVALVVDGGARLMFFAGKGGVGKTTLACAAGLAAGAEAEKDVLLVSVDPAHSLSDCLGVELGSSPRRIDGRVFGVELDAPSEFRALRDEYRDELEAMFEGVLGGADASFDREAMEGLLDLAPPGLDELMALTRIVDTLEHERFETVILDTAPTGHLLRLLQLPGLIERWLGSIFKVLLKYRNVLKLPRITARLVKLSKGVKRVAALLSDGSSSCVYVVSIPTEMALAETRDLVGSCVGSGIRVAAVMLNQCMPTGGVGLAATVAAREGRVREEFKRSFPGMPLVSVVRYGPPRGLEALRRLSDQAFESRSRVGAGR